MSFVEAKNGPWASTRLLLVLRWRMVRSWGTRILALSGGMIILAGLLTAINLGYFVQILAQGPRADISTIYARSWVDTLYAGNMGVLGAFAIGGSIAVSLFSPFTGSTSTSLVPSEDLSCVRPNRGHRFFDALIINAFSGIGLLQLITLTGVTSLLVMDGIRLWAILFTWVFWAFLISLTTTLGFIVEWVGRKFGKRIVQLVGLVGLLALGLALWVDDAHGTTLFGVAKYHAMILRLSVPGFQVGSLLAILVASMIVVGTVVAGVWACNKALSIPPRFSTGSGRRTSRALGRHPSNITSKMFLRVLWRTREVRRPLVALMVLGIPVVVFTDLNTSLAIAFPLTIPLAVSLAWGVNIFGIFGQGMNWLGSTPHVMSYIPRHAYVIQTAMSLGMLSTLWGVSWIMGKTENQQTTIFFVSSVAVAAMSSGFSILLSVLRPIRAPLSGNGDSLVPPLTALGYLVLLIVVSCLPGILLANIEDWQTQVWGVFVTCLASLVILYIASYKWKDTQHRAKVIATVSSD